MTALREKLAKARALILEVRARLDTHEDRCDACGLQHRRNWNEYQIAEQLDGLGTKLKRIVESDRFIEFCASHAEGGTVERDGK